MSNNQGCDGTGAKEDGSSSFAPSQPAAAKGATAPVEAVPTSNIPGPEQHGAMSSDTSTSSKRKSVMVVKDEPLDAEPEIWLVKKTHHHQGVHEEGSSSLAPTQPAAPLEDAPLPMANLPSPQQQQGDDDAYRLFLRNHILNCVVALGSGNIMAASTALQCLVSAASLAAGSPLHRAAVAFGEALGARMMRSLPGLALALQLQAPAPPTLAAANAARQSFAALCPPVRVAATAANHVILEAMAAEQWVHIVDLSGASTSQWIELLHLFATRPGGPPSLRLTVVNDQDDFLAQAAGLLTQEAVRLHVPFMFMPVRSHIDRMLLPSAASLNVVPGLGEALVISSTLQLHRLIADELTITLPPAAVSNNDQELTTTTTTKQITKADGLLHALSELKPKLLVLTEHEVDHNSPDLSDRVPNAFDYYTVLYRDLEGLGFVDRVTVEHVLLREEVMDIVTSDGVQRRERHEVMARWEQRMQVAGFQPAQVNISAGKAAARLARQLNNGGLSMFMTHKADKGCLFVCSRNKPLFAVSAWVPVPSE